MNGHDGSTRPEVGVADQCIELSSRFDQTLVDQLEPLGLLGAVTGPETNQGSSPLAGCGERCQGTTRSPEAQEHEQIRLDVCSDLRTILGPCSMNPS